MHIYLTWPCATLSLRRPLRQETYVKPVSTSYIVLHVYDFIHVYELRQMSVISFGKHFQSIPEGVGVGVY